MHLHDECRGTVPAVKRPVFTSFQHRIGIFVSLDAILDTILDLGTAEPVHLCGYPRMRMSTTTRADFLEHLTALLSARSTFVPRQFFSTRFLFHYRTNLCPTFSGFLSRQHPNSKGNVLRYTFESNQ
jgi:hypothetical protein